MLSTQLFALTSIYIKSSPTKIYIFSIHSVTFSYKMFVSPIETKINKHYGFWFLEFYRLLSSCKTKPKITLVFTFDFNYLN